MNLRVPNRLRKSHNLLILSLLLASSIALGQDAVNPCEILSESINCTAPGMHGAEIDFKTIKLNSKRKTNPMANVGDALVISTGIRYTKRAKVELTTTFNGGCPPRTETKRIKPDVNVTYTATLDGNSYSGSGAEFTLNAPLAIGSYPLIVNFTAAAANGCIDNAPITTSKTFLLDVIDGAYILNLTAQKTGTAIPVAEGTYLCKDQGQQLDLTVTFSDPLANLPFSANDIVWTVSPPNAGSFTGPGGANGDTVTWTQADDFVSALEDDLVITVNAPDMQPRTFALTVFGVNSTSGVLAPNSTQTFLIENANIAPADANKSVIVAALGGITDVGTGTATKLRTRTFTGASPFGQLESEIFLPAEGDQANPALQIIKKATFMLSGSDLMVEIQSGPVVGDVNITWEQDRPGGTRQILHREHMTVTTGMPAHTVVLKEQGTTDEGPLFKVKGDVFKVEAIITPGPPPTGYPKWTVTHNVPSFTVSPPIDGATEFDMSTLPQGFYTVETKVGEDPAEKDQIIVNIIHADIDVDTNRNGIVEDDLDDDLTGTASDDEATFTKTSGAIFAVNHDDDNRASAGIHPDAIDFDQYGVPMDEDFKINHVDDVNDIAPITIRGVGSKSGLQYFLRIDPEKIKGIHIFNGRIALSEVLKDAAGNYWTGWDAHHTNSRPNYLDITPYVDEHTDLLLGIESLFYPGTKIFEAGYTSFDGEIEIEFIVQKDTGGTTIDMAQEVSKDTVKMRVAPFMLLPNTQHAEEVYMESSFSAYIPPAPISPSPPCPGSPPPPTPPPPYPNIKNLFESFARPKKSTPANQWFQDHVQIGFTGFPNSTSFTGPTVSPVFVAESQPHALIRMPYQNGQNDWPEKYFLSNGQASFRFRNLTEHGTSGIPGTGTNESGDFGGNLELIPKSDTWKLGRILVGDTMSTEMQEFLKAQKLDAGYAVQDPIVVDAKWLSVGHVDEFVGFVEGGSQDYKVAHADPLLAYELLKNGKYGIPNPQGNDPLFSTGSHISGRVSGVFTGTTQKFLFDGAAHGTIKIKKRSKFTDGKTLSLNDGNQTVIFEFDDNGSVGSGNVLVNIFGLSTEAQLGDALFAQVADQANLGNLDIHAYQDGSDFLLLINKAVTSAGNTAIATTVDSTGSNAGIGIEHMSGGKDVGLVSDLTKGRDYPALLPPCTTLNWVRLISGPGAGQVVKVEDIGPGWLKLDTMGSNFYKTTSQLMWDFNGSTDGLYKRLKSTSPGEMLQIGNTWFGTPNATTEYIAVEECRIWYRKNPTTSTYFTVPALWSVKEYLSDMDTTSGPSLLNEYNTMAGARINIALKAIADGMGTKTSSSAPFLSTDKMAGSVPVYLDSDDDHLTSDNDDDFLSVPAIFFGAIYKPPSSSTFQMVDRTAIAYTPGLANFQPASMDFVVFPKPYMPKVSGSPVDIFEEAVRHVMGHTTTNNRVRFADDWDVYHAQDGEVHCGTAAKRKRFTTPWWGMLP